jgi:hypothetical protein
MLPIFSKALEDVSVEDIEALIREGYPEDATTEFKERIPHKTGGQDAWYSGGKVEDYGRNKILEEVVAFANSHGGHLLLGIKESKDKPHPAIEASPIPRCADLAETLRLQIRDCIEPHIPIINARGVPTNEDGSGVVIIRVPESQMAPHRLMPTGQCYFRHADRAETMKMRDIQDLTIQRTRGSERLEQAFAKRGAIFRDWIKQMDSPTRTSAGCRVTLIPTADLYAKEVNRKPELLPRLQTFTLVTELGSNPIEAFLARSAYQDRPILRGVRRVDDEENPNIVQELHCTGLAEICFRATQLGEADAALYQTWILGAVCNGFVMADAFRRGIGAPDVEYAFEVEIASTMSYIPINFSNRNERTYQTPTTSNPCLYPRMSLGGYEEIPKLLEIVISDIWNSCGMHFPYHITSWK